MVNAWPSSVPLTAAAGSLNEEQEDTRAKFDPDAGGPPILRQRQSVDDSIVSLSIEPITSTQKQTIQDFYRDNQALVFTSAHPDPEILGTLNWQFEQPPKFRHISALFYSCALVLRLRP